MNKKFSRILGVGLALVLAIAIAVPMMPAVEAKKLDWGEVDLPKVKVGIVAEGWTVQPGSDILSLSAANDGKTAYVAISDEGTANISKVMRTTNGGQGWATKSPSGANVTIVAVSPDDPAVVVAAGNVTGAPYVWISTDKAETWSASAVSGELSGTITSLAISVERDDTRWVAVGSDAAAKCLAVAKAEAFAGWDTAGGTTDNWTGWNSADATGGVLALAFSPWFGYDNTLLVVTVSGSKTNLQAAEVADTFAACEFNASTTPFASYPAEIGVDIVATAASISLPDEYYGLDSAERVAYIGTTAGVYRLEDTDSNTLKSGNVPWVAYNSEDNKLLVGYGDSGRADMSDNPDTGSPSFTRPTSMKSPSGEAGSGVAWLDSTMMCATKEATSGTNADDESAISISTDAKSWNQLSLIDTDLDNITDMVVSADGSKIYVASQSIPYTANTSYSVWRYASRWERVLCNGAEGSTNLPIVRLAPEKPEVVLVGLKGTEEIRRSTDSGDSWKQSRADAPYGIVDMALKDDKVVHAVNGYGWVSTSKDGGRTFADYTKSYVSANQMIVAPNGDVLVVGENQIGNKISVGISTDDGASWSRMAEDTGLTRGSGQIVLVAVDTDYATNNKIYVATTDSDEAHILRWTVGGDLEVWDDISAVGYTVDATDTIQGMGCAGGVLYLAYFTSSTNTSGFISTGMPTIKRTSVVWGGGTGAAEKADAQFTITPQALQISTGSANTLWAIDATVVSGKGNRLYSYTDILAKVAAPILTAPADGFVGTVDAALYRVNAMRFSWEEVDYDVSYQFVIGTPTQWVNYVFYSAGTNEFISIEDSVTGGTNTFAFVPGETYYWVVRVNSPTVGPWSESRSFTIAEVEAAAAPEIVVTVPEIVVPAPEITVEVPPAPTAPVAPVIPTYLLWVIIGVGAVLVIAVIVLIVRTRRVV